MKRQQAKELLPIIKAFAEGKTIQYYTNLTPHWIDIDPDEAVNFSDYPSNYRIKPEPKYRPFKNQNECWTAMQKHKPFGYVKDKKVNDYYIIDGVYYSDDFNCPVASMSGKAFTYKEMIDNYLFADGTPFGIKE